MLGSLFLVQEAFAAPSPFFPNEHNGIWWLVAFVVVGTFVMWASRRGEPPPNDRR